MTITVPSSRGQNTGTTIKTDLRPGMTKMVWTQRLPAVS